MLESAERTALADHPLIPLYFYVNKHLVKPEVRGWYDNVMNVLYSQDLDLAPPRPRRAERCRSLSCRLAQTLPRAPVASDNAPVGVPTWIRLRADIQTDIGVSR